MKRLRLTLLVLTLIIVLSVFSYRRLNSVTVQTVNFQSQLIGRLLPYNVILPRGYALPGRRYPVLYLLHGHGGDHSSWIAHTKVKEYLTNFDLVIVTPEAQDGWYTDSATDEHEKFESFLVNELIPDVEKRFRVIPERRARAIAGYSMGGYGALKFGLKYPQLFAFAGSLSGAFDAPLRTDESSIVRTFGPSNSPTRERNDLTRIAGGVVSTSLPQLYLDCGTSDPWLSSNRDLHRAFERLSIKHDYEEMQGGHDWAYWDRQIRVLLPRAASAVSAAPQ
jgi:putative tributyrin esterase